MKRWKIAIFLMLIFLAGAASGSLVTRLMIRKKNVGVLQELQGRNPQAMNFRIYTRLDKRLQFTPDQQQPVQAAIGRFLSDMSALRKQQRPRMGEILERSIADIKSVLNEVQKQELDRIIRKVREQRDFKEEGGGS